MQLQEDEEHIQTLTSITNVDSDTARRVYIKHNKDLDRAAEALLLGEIGQDDAWSQRQNTPEPNYYDTNDPPPIRVTPAPSGTTIDLTGEVDPYQTIPASTFGPSNRAPDPNWQMVSSNTAIGSSTPLGISQDDQSLNDAIQASLNDHFVTEEKDDLPLTHNVREGGRPIAIRPEAASLACAALIVQALYYVPQIRSAVGQLHLPDISAEVPFNHPARGVWNLIELFTNMDLAQLSILVDEAVLPSLENEVERDRMSDSPSERATAILNYLGPTLEAHFSAQQDDDESMVHLFGFMYVHVDLNSRLPRKVGRATKGSVVKIDIGGLNEENDLVSRLSSNLSVFEEGKSAHDVIVEPSQMIAFSLSRIPQDRKGTIPFSYPKSFFLDRFMFRNLELANRKRAQEQEYAREIIDLTKQRETLTRLNQRDTIQDLQSTINYFENVATTSNADPIRQQNIKSRVDQLKDVLLMIESKVEAIDRRLRDLEALSENVYNVPELQRFQYDLRAVLMHTGLPGRKQMYSYVQDVDGIWWKTCDYEVTEVTEELVLGDAAGLHLSAGPFLLLYSMHLSEEELRRPVSWPRRFADAVEENNKKFLSMLPADAASKAKKRRSPPIVIPGPRPATPSRREQFLPQPPRSGSVTMGPRPVNRGKTLDPSGMSVDS